MVSLAWNLYNDQVGFKLGVLFLPMPGLLVSVTMPLYYCLLNSVQSRAELHVGDVEVLSPR